LDVAARAATAAVSVVSSAAASDDEILNEISLAAKLLHRDCARRGDALGVAIILAEADRV
jgi:hypothetical protein